MIPYNPISSVGRPRARLSGGSTHTHVGEVLCIYTPARFGFRRGERHEEANEGECSKDLRELGT